jgi:lysophospholipase L1-like esterase
VHLACSGAGIASGELGPYWGIAPGDATEPLGSQLDTLKQLVGTRRPDAILLSIGINDLGFGDIIEFCVKWTDCQNRKHSGDQTLARVTLGKLGQLARDLYPQLAQKLKQVAPGVPVLISQYPDPTQDANGTTCDDMVDVAGIRAIRQGEADWMSGYVLQPLNKMITTMAQRYGWHLVAGAEQGFHRHGYCAGDKSWVVTLDQSKQNEGDTSGTLHPNSAGQQYLATLLTPLLTRLLYPDGKPKPLR